MISITILFSLKRCLYDKDHHPSNSYATVHSLASALLAILLTNGCSAPESETEFYSSSIFLPDRSYTVDAVAFADVDRDDEEDFIFLDATEGLDFATLRVGNVSDGGIKIKWSSGPQADVPDATKFDMGNIDSDPQSELALICTSQNPCDGNQGIVALDWNSNGFTVLTTSDLPIIDAALLDVDGDNVDEIAYAVYEETSGLEEDENLVSLKIDRFTTDGLKSLHVIKFPCLIRSMITHDVDGDGVDEIITEEESSDVYSDYQIAIYRISTTDGIKIAIKEHVLFSGDLNFMRVFEYDGDQYLFLEYGKGFWKTVFKIVPNSEQSFELIVQGLFKPRLWTAAVRTTMASSASRNQLLQIGDDGSLDWQPKTSED